MSIGQLVLYLHACPAVARDIIFNIFICDGNI